MRIMTVASQKGGVGKTTVSLNLGFALAKRGWRTLIVDSDPQGAIGLSLSRKLSGARGLAEYVAGRHSLPQLLSATRLPELSLLPVGQIAVQDTPGFGAVLSDGRIFRDLGAEASALFDVVVIDTPSGFQGITLGALRASSHVLSPVQAEPIALRSLSQLLEVVSSLREEGCEVELLGLLLIMMQMRQSSSLSVADELWAELDDLVFQTVIPRDPAFLDASAAGVPLGLLGRRPPFVAATFDQLASEVEGRMKLNATEDSANAPIPLVD